jgi:uncharacterized YigZ family protein
MDPARRYPVPARNLRSETVIERSRFITTLGPAATTDAARQFVAAVAAEFPDASHNCWAFVVGPPGDTGRIGMSDAGEPRGTAGRPMLNALLGSGVGDVAAVVTRYFGGVKLGTGGLVRAYGGCVKEALASLPLEEHVERVEMALESSYAGAPELRRLLDQAGALVLEETYGAEVLLRVSVPLDEEPEFLRSLGRLHGLVRVLPGPRPG